jgi:hypothetical protein
LIRAPCPRCPTRMTLPSWPQQPQQPAKMVGPTKPSVSDLSISPPAQRSTHVGQKIPVRGQTMVAARSIQGHFRWRALTERRGGPWKRESGKGELTPPLPCVRPPLHCHRPRIQAQREYNPPAASPHLGQHSKPISSTSVSIAIHCGHGWPLTLPRPQVR